MGVYSSPPALNSFVLFDMYHYLSLFVADNATYIATLFFFEKIGKTRNLLY